METYCCCYYCRRRRSTDSTHMRFLHSPRGIELGHVMECEVHGCYRMCRKEPKAVEDPKLWVHVGKMAVSTGPSAPETLGSLCSSRAVVKRRVLTLARPARPAHPARLFWRVSRSDVRVYYCFHRPPRKVTVIKANQRGSVWLIPKHLSPLPRVMAGQIRRIMMGMINRRATSFKGYAGHRWRDVSVVHNGAQPPQQRSCASGF
jgi:hypothetical protein